MALHLRVSTWASLVVAAAVRCRMMFTSFLTSLKMTMLRIWYEFQVVALSVSAGVVINFPSSLRVIVRAYLYFCILSSLLREAFRLLAT